MSLQSGAIAKGHAGGSWRIISIPDSESESLLRLTVCATSIVSLVCVQYTGTTCTSAESESEVSPGGLHPKCPSSKTTSSPHPQSGIAVLLCNEERVQG